MGKPGVCSEQHCYSVPQTRGFVFKPEVLENPASKHEVLPQTRKIFRDLVIYVVVYAYVYIYIYAYAYTGTYMCLHVYIYMCIYVCKYLCMCVYKCICVCICIYMYMHT